MQMQEKRAMLEAQVQSLKEIVKTLESTNPEDVSRKWRAKVFEELMRNKQQQLSHASELRKSQDDTRRVQAKAEELLSALQKCQSSLAAVSQENTMLQQRLTAERQEKAVLVSIQKQQQVLLLASPQHLQGQFEVLAQIMGKVDRYEKKVSICHSQIRATKIILDRERTARTKHLRDLRNESEKLKSQTYQSLAIIAENESLKRHIAELQSQLQLSNKEKSEIAAEGRLRLEERSAEWTQIRESLENQLKQTENQLKDVRFAHESAQGEIAVLKTSLSAAVDSNSTHAADGESLKSRIVSLETALISQKTEQETVLQRVLQEHQSRSQALQREHDSLAAEYRSALLRKDEEMTTLRCEFDVEREELVGKIAAMERSLKDMKRDRGLLLSSLKSQERKTVAATAVKEVQTVAETGRNATIAGRPMAKIDDLFEQCRDLLDAP